MRKSSSSEVFKKTYYFNSACFPQMQLMPRLCSDSCSDDAQKISLVGWSVFSPVALVLRITRIEDEFSVIYDCANEMTVTPFQ